MTPTGSSRSWGVGRATGDVVASDNPLVDKAFFFFSIIAGVNLFLFLFNLVPLLPLDGGHVVGAVWDSIKRGWARLFHKPRPAPADVARGLPIAYVVSVLLVLMGAIAIYADIVMPIKVT